MSDCRRFCLVPQDAGEEMKHLENDLKEMDDLRLQLAEYFCEEEKTFRLDDCIKTFASFVDRFQKTIQVSKCLQAKKQFDCVEEIIIITIYPR